MSDAPDAPSVGDGGESQPNRPDISVGAAIPPQELERLSADIIAALKTVFDPEIPVDIYELGLIYRVDISDDRDVLVDMTLTAPGCPVAGDMPGWVQDAVEGLGPVAHVRRGQAATEYVLSVGVAPCRSR
jgi:metal-sulfur cluster biosynthetic enzyme